MENVGWKMKMNPTDLADVGGYTYTLSHERAGPLKNWTGLFRPGERYAYGLSTARQ